MIDPDGFEDIYFLLGNTLSKKGETQITIKDFTVAMKTAIAEFEKKGYTVAKPSKLTLESFRKALK